MLSLNKQRILIPVMGHVSSESYLWKTDLSSNSRTPLLYTLL